MKKPALPAAARFVDEIRALYASEPDVAKRWAAIRERMKPFLADPGLRASIATWPLTVDGAPVVGNLLFYEDPDHGFVFNATVRKPNLVTNVHDHGDVWTLYGLIEGHETMVHYERIDDGPRDAGPARLRITGTDAMGPGDIDAVPPGAIHQERAGPRQSVSFIVRAKRGGTFQQRNFDPDTGEVRINWGPRQIEHALG